MQNVINIDGHAIPTGQFSLVLKKSYLRLPTPQEQAEEHRRFWIKTVMKVNNGTTKRLPNGKLQIKMYGGTYEI